MTLPLDLSGALEAFTHPAPIRVTETEGQIVNGRYQIVDLPERTIRASVLQIERDKLQFLPSGDASDSGINLMTRSELFFTDPKEETTQNKQSYVHYEGYKYRVVATGFTKGNSIFNSYDCLRYMDL